MAEARRCCITLPVAAVLMFGAGPMARAQSSPAQSSPDQPVPAQSALAQPARIGSLTGKLTDLHSAPLNGVAVIVRNQATGTEARTITGKNGTYRFTGLDAGQYTLEADSPRLGRGRLEDIQVAAGDEARVQSAMQLELPPPAPIHMAFHDMDPVPALVSVPLPIESLRSMPLQGRPAPSVARDLARDPPAAAIPVITATLPVEQPRVLPFGGRRQNLAVAAIGPAPGRAEPTASAAPVASNLALTETASSMAQAAMLLSQLQLKIARADSLRAAAQAVDPVTPAVTTTVSAEQLQALPASGRRWQDFVLDTPKAATAVGGASQPSLRGAGQEPAETTIDGVSTRLAFGEQGNTGPRQYSQTEARQSGEVESRVDDHSLAVAEAAIRQVETVAGNVEAEGSRAAGGRMNVETQRGVNGLHGQGFIFDRQNTWGARNPYTQWVTETTPATLTYNPSGPPLSVPIFDNGPNGTPESYTPPDHETVWGIGFGSQIRRDKLFWFAALDSYNRNDPGLAMVKHPYLVETLTGCVISPCTQTTGFFAQPSNCQMQVLSVRLGLASGPSTGCVSGLIQGLGAYSSMLETLAGLLGPAPRTSTQWLGFARIDWQAAERHRLTLEGAGAAWAAPGGGLTRVSETYGNHSFGASNASEQWLLARWEAFLTPNLLAVTQGSAGRTILSAHPDTPSAFEQTFLSANAWGQLPQISVDTRYGFTIGNPSRFGQGSYPDERLFAAQENVDWVRGLVLVKAGLDLSHNADATSLLRNQTGTYSYSNVENFISDALVFQNFGLAGELNPSNPRNCDQTGTVWTSSIGQTMGLGSLPCYSYYSQTMGPSNWHLSTNDWASYATAQWQPRKWMAFSAGLRWEREQLPPPLAALNNPELSLSQKLPNLGNNWGPRISLAVGGGEGRRLAWPVLRLGYGMYFGRVDNATLETALTQTGSPNGDQSFFLRPTDNLNGGGAPPFPYVLTGSPGSIVKAAAVEFAPRFRNPEVHQALAAIEETLPGHLQLTADALVSLGRRLPVPINTNLDLPASQQSITYSVVDGAGAGPIKAPQITVPSFYASWPRSEGVCPYYTPTTMNVPGWLCPDYQQIDNISSKANSTYEAAMVKVVRYGSRGLSLHAHYTYAHAMDWNPNESPLDPNPANFNLEYGTSNLDVRHSAAALVIYEAPWKLHSLAGKLANGWMVSGIGQFRSGLPYTMRTSGALAREFTTTGVTIAGLGPGMNGSGGDNRVYGMGSDGRFYNIGRNTYRYPATWKADLRFGKSFNLGRMRQLQVMAESFNLFNHQNVTELETTGYYIEPGNLSGGLPTLNFLTGLKAGTTAFGQPLNIDATDFYRERQIQLGLRMRF